MEGVFVSRKKELAKLGEYFAGAVAGRGRVCFVTGEAGFGKTSLALEFARQAQQQRGDLLVALGSCDAQTGLGDPYLPFRELLGMLTGEGEERASEMHCGDEWHLSPRAVHSLQALHPWPTRLTCSSRSRLSCWRWPGSGG